MTRLQKVPARTKKTKSAVAPLCTLNGQLESFSAFDLINLLHEKRKTGRLQVQVLPSPKNQTGQKNIYLKEGEVIFASSTLKQDRLGDSLVRSGRISEAQFAFACKSLGSGDKLGKILVENGFISPGKLWIGVKNQVEEIFYSVLKIKKGGFNFFEGSYKIDNVVRLSRSVRSLILEGVRQTEELKIFVEKIINHQTVFIPLNLPSDVELTDVERKIYDLMDGERIVRKILALSPTSPFVTLKVLSNLMLAKVITPKDLHKGGAEIEIKPVKEPSREMAMLEPSEETSDVVPMVVEIAVPPIHMLEEEADDVDPCEVMVKRYNKAYVEIHRIMEDFGYPLGRDLDDYLNDSESPFRTFFNQLTWQEEGGLDQEALLGKMAPLHPDLWMDFLNRGLEDLLFFLLFKTQGFLPKEISDTLIQTVEEFHHE